MPFRSRLPNAVLLVVAVALVAQTAAAVPFVVTDADFASGVYELRYLTGSNRLQQNGTFSTLDATPLDDLFLTNTSNTVSPAWEYFGADPGVTYLKAPGSFGTSAAATMGWDLSGVTGQIASVELISNHNIFQFFPHNLTAQGDSIFGDVATPAAFGGGPYTNMYTHTSNNPMGLGPDFLGTNGVVDITSLLPGGWLSNPNLLELRFGYQLVDSDIPNIHLQLFRDGTFTGDDSFMLRITLVPEPGLASLLACGALLVAYRRR